MNTRHDPTRLIAIAAAAAFAVIALRPLLQSFTGPRHQTQPRTASAAEAPALHPSAAQPPDSLVCAEFFACGAQPHRGFSACYAPGTTPEYIEEFESAFFSHGGAEAFSLYGRWSFTATDGATGGNGDPIVLTYSFPPDTNTGDPTTSNVMHATFDAAFGSRSAWKNLFAEILNEWSATCGITFVEVPDDGATWPGASGALGARGDVRIVCWAIDGLNGVLAYNYYPNVGDMALDAAENWANPSLSYRFLRNVVAHELGHGLGLNHVLPRDGTKLMEAYLTMGFVGPQDDDVRGINAYYGDPAEPNDQPAAPAGLGALASVTIEDLTLHDHTDVDWFEIEASPGQSLAVEVAPVGATYQVGPDPGTPVTINTRAINPLRVEIYDESGTQLLRSATAAAAGQSAATLAAALPAGTTAFLVRVSTSGGTPNVQRYSLGLSATGAALRTLTISSAPNRGVTVNASPADASGVSSATTFAALTYGDGQSVTLTAPAAADLLPFSRWLLDGVAQPPAQRTLSVTMNADHQAVAAFGDGPVVDAGPDRSLVAGESTQLACTVTGGTPPYSYQWSPAGTLSGAQTASPLAMPAATTTYTVLVSDSGGQQSTDSVTVTVTGGVSVSAGPDRNAAADQDITLTATVTGGTPPYFYRWSPEQPLIDGATSETVVARIAETTAFTVTVEDAEGRAASDSLYVYVAPPLSVTAGDDQSILYGEAVELVVRISGGLGPFEIDWTPGGRPTRSDNSAILAQPRQTTTYTVEVADAAGQTAGAAVTVRVTPPLEVRVIAGETVLDYGQTITLEARATGGVEPLTFEWSPTEDLADPAAAVTEATPFETTQYTVTVTDAVGQQAAAAIVLEVTDPDDLSPTPLGLCGAGIAQALVATAIALALPRRRLREWRMANSE